MRLMSLCLVDLFLLLKDFNLKYFVPLFSRNKKGFSVFVVSYPIYNIKFSMLFYPISQTFKINNTITAPVSLSIIKPISLLSW